jgi:type I restriction enzyme R subunit
MPAFTESIIESAALAWLERLGWTVKHGPDIAPGELAAERSDYGQVILTQRLQDALAQLNPALPAEALDEAFRKLTRPEGPTLEARNRAVHRLLVDGVTVEYRTADGAIRGAQAQGLDFDDPDHNDWLAVNQFTVSEHKHTRRPDVVLFVNGLPLALIELKNAADEDATIWTTFQQLQTYKAELPTLFAFNAALVISDGLQARIGTLTAGREWFKPWRTISGESLADPHLPELQVLIEGVFDKRRLLDLVRHFIVFEDAGGPLVKKMAGYHQFHAVNVAVAETLRAAQLQREADRVAELGGRYEAGQRRGGQPGDRRIGVVWHTQGSGKSLTMAFYAGRVIREPHMANPTIVVLTNRNDLDDQLFGTFSRCLDLLRQPPVQAESRAHLRELLRVEAGGVVFTTIQKFLPDVGAAPCDRPSVGQARGLPLRYLRGATSSSSPTKRTAASTTSSTASPGPCATRCPAPRSSASRGPPSRRPKFRRGTTFTSLAYMKRRNTTMPVRTSTVATSTPAISTDSRRIQPFPSLSRPVSTSTVLLLAADTSYRSELPCRCPACFASS